MTQKDSLFQTADIADVTLKNRLTVAPLTRTSATEDGVPTERMVEYYREYAEGGFGLIISEGTYTDLLYSQGYFNQPGVVTVDQVRGWKRVTDAVHKAGGKIFVQLMHAGAQSQGNIFKHGTIAPSAVRPRSDKLAPYGGEGAYDLPQAMTRAQIDQVIGGFAQSARNAVIAGFDGIEIHGANGYLIDEFFTDYFNERKDEYGVSRENRARFATQVIDAVKEAVHGEIPVGIRISQLKATDHAYRWHCGEEVAKVTVRALTEAGADFIHVSDYHATEPGFQGQEGDETFAGAVKRLAKDVPVIVAGHLEDPADAARMIETDQTDFVALGKAAIADPAWPNHVQSGAPVVPFTPDLFAFGPTLAGVDQARDQMRAKDRAA